MINGASVHWTQKPENAAKLRKVLKRMRVAKKTINKLSKAERIVKKQVKVKKVVPNAGEAVDIVLNGWKLTLGHRKITIEQS